MRLNRKTVHPVQYTHEGAVASRISPEEELLRLTCSCLLWEDTFYVDGKTIVQQIEDVCERVSEDVLVNHAVSLKETHNLRHVPLLLAIMAVQKKRSTKAKRLLARIIQRPDELCETLAIYWKYGRTPLASQLKKGLRKAFMKFDQYQLGKWNKERDITLRDVMFLTHPKPVNEEKEKVYRALANNSLAKPKTWEKRLSAGESKKKTFSELMQQKKLGFQACLMNLRNMLEGGIDRETCGKYLVESSHNARVLPFQFVSALKACPEMLDWIEKAYFKSFKPVFRFAGTTIILVDVSASMRALMSDKGSTSRMDTAAALAMFARECCTDPRFYSFSWETVSVPPYRGFGIIPALCESQTNGGTFLAGALHHLMVKGEKFDRIFIISDEQADVGDFDFPKNTYIINLAPYQKGVGYGKAIHINGFSPKVFDFIHQIEAMKEEQYA